MPHRQSERPEGVVSITEFARLQRISTDTLRYYDKIGLFKPAWRDPDTGLRYYSLATSDDVLTTIVELRELDMSIAEIKDYLYNRSLHKSLALFRTLQETLTKKINHLSALDETIKLRINAMEHVLHEQIDFENVSIKHFGNRHIFTSNSLHHNDAELNHEAIRLQRAMAEIAPITGTGRFIIDFSHSLTYETPNEQEPSCRVGILLPDDSPERIRSDAPLSSHFEEMPSGSYACIFRWGDPLDIEESYRTLQSFCKQRSIKLENRLIEVTVVDQSVTDVPEERIFELQALINTQ